MLFRALRLTIQVNVVAEGEEMLPKLQTHVHKPSAGIPAGIETLIAMSIRLRWKSLPRSPSEGA